jgi:hypothetical protein
VKISHVTVTVALTRALIDSLSARIPARRNRGATTYSFCIDMRPSRRIVQNGLLAISHM